MRRRWGGGRHCENDETLIDMEDLEAVPHIARLSVTSRGRTWCYDVRELARLFHDRHNRGEEIVYLDPRTNIAFTKKALKRILERIALCHIRGVLGEAFYDDAAAPRLRRRRHQ